MKSKFLFFLAAVTFFLCSCGGTTVKVKQSSDGVNASVSVQTNNPTNVNVTPSVSVTLDDLDKVIDKVSDSLEFDDNGEMSIPISQLIKAVDGSGDEILLSLRL